MRTVGDEKYSEPDMEQRFALAQTNHISQRLLKSPFLRETLIINQDVSICYSSADGNVISLVADYLGTAYGFVKNWFTAELSIQIQLWLASDLIDLQYMTATRCSDDFAFSPGRRDGHAIIVCQSPQTARANRDARRLISILIHETAHHFIRNLCGATDQTMKRKEYGQLPMWLEEGLCLYLQSEFDQNLKPVFSSRLNNGKPGYRRHELWNDLSAVDDVPLAYALAYHWVEQMLAEQGKERFIARLMSVNP